MNTNLIIHGVILLIVAAILSYVKGMFDGLTSLLIYIVVVVLVLVGIIRVIEGLIGPLRQYLRVDLIINGLVLLALAYILDLIRGMFFREILSTLVLILVIILVIVGVVRILQGLLVGLKMPVEHEEHPRPKVYHHKKRRR